VRAKAWALGEDLFAESKKILGKEKTLSEEFFAKSQKNRAFSRLSVKKFF
jgi:hypothetical protein